MQTHEQVEARLMAIPESELMTLAQYLTLVEQDEGKLPRPEAESAEKFMHDVIHLSFHTTEPVVEVSVNEDGLHTITLALKPWKVWHDLCSSIAEQIMAQSLLDMLRSATQAN